MHYSGRQQSYMPHPDRMVCVSCSLVGNDGHFHGAAVVVVFLQVALVDVRTAAVRLPNDTGFPHTLPWRPLQRQLTPAMEG